VSFQRWTGVPPKALALDLIFMACGLGPCCFWDVMDIELWE